MEWDRGGGEAGALGFRGGCAAASMRMHQAFLRWAWSSSKQMLRLELEVGWRNVIGAPKASPLGPCGRALTDEKAKHFENPLEVFQLLERYLTVLIALSAAHLQWSVQGCNHYTFQTSKVWTNNILLLLDLYRFNMFNRPSKPGSLSEGFL